MSMPMSPRLVAPGAGKSITLYGVRFAYKVESADSGGSLAVLEIEIAGKTLVKPHTHTKEDEFSVILSGTLGVRVGDRVSEASEGAYLVKPRGLPHAMWNTGSSPARVVEILSPAGLERYFEEMAPVLKHEGGAGPPQYYELAQRYGITIEDDWVPELEQNYGVKLNPGSKG